MRGIGHKHEREHDAERDAERDAEQDAEHDVVDRRVEHRTVAGEPARDKFGGANLGACFFGWIVAVGVAVILTGLVAVAATAFGYSEDVTQSDAERSAGTVGVVTGVVLVAVLLVGYYAGGYVAGRMSRFDGARQGVLVWVIGLLVTAVAVILGWLAGDRYNLLDRVDLPRIPIPDDQLTWGGVITGLAILVGTLLAAMAGGKVGRRYHDRVDSYAERDI